MYQVREPRVVLAACPRRVAGEADADFPPARVDRRRRRVASVRPRVPRVRTWYECPSQL